MVPLDESLFDVWHDFGLIDRSEHGDLVKVLAMQVLPKERCEVEASQGMATPTPAASASLSTAAAPISR